jgi:hypothetical protein
MYEQRAFVLELLATLRRNPVVLHNAFFRLGERGQRR